MCVFCFVCVCVCVWYMYLCTLLWGFLNAYVCICARTCGGSRSKLDIFLSRATSCILRQILSLNLELTDLARLSGSVSSRHLGPCLPCAGITDVCSRFGIYMGARNSSSRPHACASWSLPIVPSLLSLKLVFFI